MVNFLRIRKKKADTSTIDQVLDGSATLLQIDFETIRVATGDFSVENKLGEGGFGVVYKGILPADGKEIAVKRLSRNSGQGVQEFMNEVALGAKLHHKNLVRLYGCCVEVQEKLLVYEYIPNRSLDYFLFDPDKRPSLDWERRFKIIGGIARGLLYLHEDSRLRIIHRDLKASNILLDANMIPKISDFGMAKIIGGDQTSGSTHRIAGTFGYMAPEYAMRGQFSVKTDVYSFGVLLLEIISGQKNQYKEDCGEDLLSYVWKAWNDGTILGIIDSSISEHCSRSEVVRCINIGLLCVQEDATTRPSMSLVVMMLTSFSHTMLAVPSTPAYFNVEPTFQDSSTENQLDSSSRNSRIFHSRDALVNRARDVGKRNSFVIVIKVSNAARPGIKARVVPAYERSGYYKQSKTIDEGTTKKKIKQTGSKKCGCPFTLKGKELDTSDDWMLEVACDVHSHSAAEYLEGHSFTGRLTKEETKLMVDMSKSMVRPKDILATLKQRSELNVNNAYHRHRVVERGGRTQMQQLMNMLTEHKYIECHRNCEDSDIITDLVWAHPTSIQLLRAFPHVLIMDCTYKTNRYRMPLLEIVGVTSTDMTFSVCFAYMEAEREGNYAWALGVLRSVIGEDALPDVIVTDKELSLMKAINSVFPNARHLLCKWHINKNVLAKCKKLFETKDKWEKFTLYWNLLVHSSTEQEYIDHLRKLNQEFSTYPAALQYIKDSWLDEYKERFVSAWVDKCMHFGSTTSNRAESSHSQLKRQLGSSQGTFETNWAKTHSLLELQHTSIKASFEKSKTIVQHSFKPSEFKKLRGNISRNSLEKILAETKRSNLVGIDRIACGCILRSTHGLPCAHEIAAYISEGRPIPLESIHSHWTKLDMNPCTISKFSTIELDYKAELGLLEQRFNEYDETRKLQLLKKMRELSKPDNTFLLDPAVKTRTRGRPRTRIDTSTRREPSAFELVESTQDSHSPAPISTKAALEQKPKKGNHRVVRTRSKSVSSYTTQFSEGLRPYVRFIKDVVADGNCGFRAIAALIGHTDENGWRQVRRELLQELLAHIDNYKQLYGVENRVEELIETLSYYEEHPSYNHWLTMPDMGHLIASRYNLVLFHFSAVQCLTFLPLRSAPLPAATRLEKAIGFVNQNHFVQVFMIPDHPIPPIANKWREFHHPCANGWELAYEDRIRHFKEIISPDVATCETVSLN